MSLRSLELFAREIAQAGNRSERIRLARSANPFADLAFRDLRHVQPLLGDVANTRMDRDQAMLAALHLVWKLVPERLFTSFDPDFRSLVEQAVSNAGLDRDISSETKRNLQVIFKRLRNYDHDGRRATSLDLGRSDHAQLLSDQLGRCAVCRYEFSEADIGWSEDGDVQWATRAHRARRPDELILDQMNRSPVLDHIIPVYIGGDSDANWQIVCFSCNAGKSDAWTAVARTGFLPPSNPSSARKLTTSLRYVVLATSVADWTHTNEFVVTKRNPDGLVTFPNLQAIELFV